MKWLANYDLIIENISILRICSNNSELLISKVWNKPLIQGSTLAGALREICSKVNSDLTICLFGEEERSRIVISDGIGGQMLQETRTHVKIDGRTGTHARINSRGQLVNQEYLSANTEFAFQLEIHSESEDELMALEDLLTTGLKALHNGAVKLGSKKTSGAGAFKVKAFKAVRWNLADQKQFFMHVLGQKKADQDLMPKLKNNGKLSGVDRFFVRLDAATPVLIGGNTAYDPGKPDRGHIKDGLKRYIIPGSSVKGVLRQQCMKIAEHFKCEHIVNKLFGSHGNGTPSAGMVLFSDYVIEKPQDSVIYNRIHLDRFTAGAMEGALVEEQPVWGGIDLEIFYKKTADEAFNNKVVGLLILALKDLADGSLSLGSGFSIGRGRYSGKQIMHNDQAAIDYEKRDYSYALRYISALKG